MAEYRVIEKGKQFGKVTKSAQVAYRLQQQCWHKQEGRMDYGQAAYVQKRERESAPWVRINIQEEV